MNAIEKMQRHVGGPYEFKIGEDVFRLFPLPSENMPELFGGVLFKISAAIEDLKLDFSKLDTKDVRRVMSSLDQETLGHVRNLIYVSCKNSPDFDVGDSKLLDQFISQHFMDLMGALFEVNSQTIMTTSDRTKKIMKTRYDKSTTEGTATTPTSIEEKNQ